MGRPGRLAEGARPGAGCAMRDSDKWDALPEGGHGPAGQASRGLRGPVRDARCVIRTNGQGASAGGQARARGPCGWDGCGPGGGLVKERMEHNANNLPGRGKSPGLGQDR